ncbi:VG15 protein [Micromonospora chokoriensis]
MATPADVAAFRATQADLVTLALAELAEWWEQLLAALTGDVPVARIETFTSDLVAVFGDAAALAAVDWYDELRDQADVRGRFRARMADPAPQGQAEAVARWAVGPLFGAQPDQRQALEHLSGGVQRLVLQPARQTIADSVDEDPADARWARVPSGRTTCAFCRLLASRGAVYHSEETAGGLANGYHGECDCVPTPVWPGEQEPYDVDAFLEEYNAARAKAGGDPNAILAQMRLDLGIN